MFPFRFTSSLLLLLSFCCFCCRAAQILDAYPDKARYAPGDPIHIVVELDEAPAEGATLKAKVTDRDATAGECDSQGAAQNTATKVILTCKLPATDYRGYLVTVELRNRNASVLEVRRTALDVSSDWKRFPRYGYLAHYNAEEGAQPKQWIDELNRFHIDGLQFYDFQYRHDQPLAGTPEHPAARWKDVAGREVDAAIVRDFIDEAHAHNMMAMAYNASYSAYEDVFRRPNPLPLAWATWATPDGPRTADTAKSLSLSGTNWSTSKLFYMNQNNSDWQQYLFGQMRALFQAYPFDGWHIDTFGEKGGYAFDGSPVNYINGFKPYIDRASESLHKRILFNAVNTFGQEQIATSDADFVYSELWEDHETFGSMLWTAQQVHLANLDKALVIAAYLHRYEGDEAKRPKAKVFNTPSVLLTDASLFALGAAHIELGDGDRMLSSEYFPADTRFSVPPTLRGSLRSYYDFLTAYEVYLRQNTKPASISVHLDGIQTDATGVPNTVWTIAREQGSLTMLHLINLLGSSDPHWRDISASRPDAPPLEDLQVHLTLPGNVRSVAWASPDVAGGKYEKLNYRQTTDASGTHIAVRVPRLKYWDVLFIDHD